MKRRTRRGAIAASLAAALLASCASTDRQTSPDGPETDGDWIQASPILQLQIEDEAARLPWTHGFERLEQIRWFASVGEPAYNTLFDLAADPRDDVAAAALAALGATLDNRLVPYVQELEWSEERHQSDLALERARTLVRLGDWTQIPVLIAGLEDERLYTRSLCLDALKEATRESLGYDPRAEAETRKAAIVRWEQWWSSRSVDGLLGARTRPAANR
jgi:HEAT repeat protein